jgi:hypothetical protein
MVSGWAERNNKRMCETPIGNIPRRNLQVPPTALPSIRMQGQRHNFPVMKPSAPLPLIRPGSKYPPNILPMTNHATSSTIGSCTNTRPWIRIFVSILLLFICCNMYMCTCTCDREEDPREATLAVSETLCLFCKQLFPKSLTGNADDCHDTNILLDASKLDRITCTCMHLCTCMTIETMHTYTTLIR